MLVTISRRLVAFDTIYILYDNHCTISQHVHVCFLKINLILYEVIRCLHFGKMQHYTQKKNTLQFQAVNELTSLLTAFFVLPQNVMWDRLKKVCISS